MAERTHAVMSFSAREDFDKLRSGEEVESLEAGLKFWCIVKLDGVRPAGTFYSILCKALFWNLIPRDHNDSRASQ